MRNNIFSIIEEKNGKNTKYEILIPKDITSHQFTMIYEIIQSFLTIDENGEENFIELNELRSEERRGG